MDDTIELDLSDTEERTAAFTTANNTAAVAGINPATPKPGLEDEELQRAFKTLVTSTPALPPDLTSQNEASEVTPKLLPQQGGGDNNCTSGIVTRYPFFLLCNIMFSGSCRVKVHKAVRNPF